MSKHTDGPWVYKRNEVSGDCDHIATVAWVEEFCVGRDCGSGYSCNYEHHGSGEADARLIAAAPDLLEALKRMESAFDWFVGRSAFTQGGPLKGAAHSDRVRKEVYAAHDAVRAAIAKATGEQA